MAESRHQTEEGADLYLSELINAKNEDMEKGNQALQKDENGKWYVTELKQLET